MQIKNDDYICQESALTNGSKMVVRQRIQALLKERGVKKKILNGLRQFTRGQGMFSDYIPAE